MSTETRATERLARLRGAVEGLRAKTSDPSDISRWLFIAGAVLFPLGVFVVLLGWYGAAHTPYMFEQIPYLISGGLLGVGLVLAGGFLYFGYWLTRLIADNRERSERSTLVLERIEFLLSQNGHAPAPEKVSTNGASKLVATQKGTLLHRPDCVVVAGKPKLRTIKAGTAGFELCKLCSQQD
jgi:hypothetical protein